MAKGLEVENLKLKHLAEDIPLLPKDKVAWALHKSGSYSISCSWQYFRSQKVAWGKAIWIIIGHIPKVSFICSSATLNMSSTKD
ncbi:hypothetical protein CDL15_Pgr008742 [Punica granatum]|uniref:Uncharacterized protein n=1 Tax=Punica granatum TaxID=22663 RepID=A0A218VXF1_PUNGR|nr:hypothetical protein CDL15_Pgr008742 [Punica granatum]